MVIVAIVCVIGMWKILEKAGEQGWKALTPFYNLVTLYKLLGINSWFVLGYFATVIPFVGWIVSFVLTVYMMLALAKAFGKSNGFAAGLILLSPIFCVF